MKKKHLKWILVIAWMLVIFLMSHEPGDLSSEKSKFVMYIFNLLGLDLNSVFGEWASFAVRKTAHMTEYCILYILIFNALNESRRINKNFLIALIITVLYASSDEFHQTFIPGRAGRVADVFIDTTGAIIGSGIMYIVSTLRKRKN